MPTELFSSLSLSICLAASMAVFAQVGAEPMTVEELAGKKLSPELLTIPEPNISHTMTAEDRKIASATTKGFDQEQAEIGQGLSASSLDLFSADSNRLAGSKQGRAVVEARNLAEMLAEPMSADTPRRIPFTTLIFASHSLDGPALDDVLLSASGASSVAVVFRGIKDPNNFGKGIIAIQQLAKKHDPVSNIILDPTLFKKYNVKHVPTIVIVDPATGQESARIEGLTDPLYLTEKIDGGAKGDLGTAGPIVDIFERDIIEVMQERMAGIDWNAKREGAIERFWTKQNFVNLPSSQRSNRRIVDPTVVVVNEITDPNGKVILPAGRRVNPLRVRSFTQALIVFDPLEQRQLRQVKEILPSLKRKHSQVKLIATRIDSDKGWDGYSDLTNYFDQHVFTLTQDIRARFHLSATPSIITADKDVFYVDELGPEWFFDFAELAK